MLTRQEAMMYFGVEEDDLENIVDEFDLMVDLGPDDRIAFVHEEGTQEALHVRFERAFGFRPDDPKVRMQAQERRVRKEKEEKVRLKKNTARLKAKVAQRKAKLRDQKEG